MLCEATCDGAGSCTNTRTNDCSCSKNVCNAKCDSASDFEITTTSTSITCRYGCTTRSTCQFGQAKQIPCSGGYCLGSTSLFSGYCYYSVSCSGTTGPHFSQGDYCVAGSVVDSNVCLSYEGTASTAKCNSAGDCSLSKEIKPTTLCGTGLNYVCDEYQGWICKSDGSGGTLPEAAE